MKDLLVKVAEHIGCTTKEQLSSLLDQEIEDFSRYMSELGDWRAVGPLSSMERALIKTYLVHKLAGRVDQT